MNSILIFFVTLLICSLSASAQSGSKSYVCNYPDSIEVVEVIEVAAIEAVDFLDYVDYSLYGIIKNRVWNRLVLDREQNYLYWNHFHQMPMDLTSGLW